MRVMVIVKATEAPKGHSPHARGYGGDARIWGGMAEAGIVLVDRGSPYELLAGQAYCVRCGSLTVIDGPFAETRELVAGYSVWEVKEMDEAVAWAKRWPNPTSGRSEIEIRPLFEWQVADETFRREFCDAARGAQA